MNVGKREFVRSYLNRVEVVGPPEVKQMVKDGIQGGFRRYFGKKRNL